MSFRTRLAIWFLAGAVLPVFALGFVVRHEMTARLAAQYQHRVDALAGVIESNLAAERDGIRAALAPITDRMADDTAFRSAAVDNAGGERRYLIDYAGGAMRLAGLSMLQIQDAQGRILSSGHFRNDYDRVDADLPRRLLEVGGAALVRVRTADASFLAFAGVDSVVIAKRRFWVVGGIEAESRLVGNISRVDAMRVTLVLPGDSAVVGDAVARRIPVPLLDGPETARATIQVTHDVSELRALRASINRWVAVVALLAGVVAMVFSLLVSARISRPLAALADKAGAIDLERPEIAFDASQPGEIGVLARALAAMTSRLRESASALREAEHRATLGEVARQVNHDIRNGLTPIRNVFRHLDEQAEADPAAVAGVFAERRATLDGSIAYLEELASNYARLARRGERPRTNLGEVVRGVVAARAVPAGITLRAEGPDVFVDADPLALRRIVENLVGNALDSIADGAGRVTASLAAIGDVGQSRVRLTVTDSGCGIPEADRERIFDDFYTTKPDGTGLGLSIVRRLVMDLDGTLRVESEPGQGSRFIVELPAARGLQVVQ
ncbi:MAG TPA: HAMP domain-containing sensor histidine kinase [Candidatus Krumholzibacteria bacterium]|nr:HAMP domain-containing sensor histidine kinase [Candidatus Krumholzibacteria bacterium]